MQRPVRRTLGGLLAAAGLIGAFFTLGPALLGDCSVACVARGERAIAIALGVVCLAAAGAGALLAFGRAPRRGSQR